MFATPFLFVWTVVVGEGRFLATTPISRTVATFQSLVYSSFRQASAVIPRAIEADCRVGAKRPSLSMVPFRCRWSVCG